MKKDLLKLLIFTIILTACQKTPSTSQELATNEHSQATTISTVSVVTDDDCSQSNPIFANWYKNTFDKFSLATNALDATNELLANPSNTGIQEVHSWYEKTTQAYNYVKDYQPVPKCLIRYHELAIETLNLVSLSLSELELVYVAIDNNQDHEPHLKKSHEYLSSAFETNKAWSVESTRLTNLGLPRP